MTLPFDTLALMFGLLTMLASILAWRASRNPHSRFNFEDILLDPQTGRTSLHRVGQFVVLSVSTWGFVYLTLAYRLTEWYFAAYMLAWSGSNAMKTVADKLRPPESAKETAR